MITTKITEGNWNTACDSYGKVRHSRKYDCVFTSNNKGLVTIAARIENGADAKAIAAVPLMLDYIRSQADKGDDRAHLILDAIESNWHDALDKARTELAQQL